MPTIDRVRYTLADFPGGFVGRVVTVHKKDITVTGVLTSLSIDADVTRAYSGEVMAVHSAYSLTIETVEGASVYLSDLPAHTVIDTIEVGG